jgi:hypothetical protein
MKKVILHSNWSINTHLNKGVLQQMSLMKTVDASVDFLHYNTLKKTVTSINDISGVGIRNHISRLNEVYDVVLDTKPVLTWEEVYNDLDVSFLEGYDSFYIFGGAFNGNFTRGNENNFPLTKRGVNWQSSGKPMTYLTALLKANRKFGTPIHEVVFDPLEMSLNIINPEWQPTNHNVYHGYDFEEYGFKRLDSLQYFLTNNTQPTNLFFEDETEKEFDLVFGYTNIDGVGSRKKIIDTIQAKTKQAQEQLKNVRILLKDKVSDNTVPRDEYLQLIKKARFTLLFPAYDSKSFSIYRLIESLHNDCLPIVSPLCNIEPINKSFGVDLKDLQLEEFPSESRRLELLSHFKDKICRFEKGFME